MIGKAGGNGKEERKACVGECEGMGEGGKFFWVEVREGTEVEKRK